MMRWGWCSLHLTCFLAACDPVVDMGTDIVWSTDNETGDLAAWSQSPGVGGSYRVAGSPTLGISTDQAHSGTRSVRITSSATNALPAPYSPGGAGFYKVSDFPSKAYYSAWFFVPRAVTAALNWNIVRFGFPAPSGGGATLFPMGSTVPLPFEDAGLDSSADAAAPMTAAPSYAELIDVRLRYQPSGETTVVLYDHRLAYREERMPSPVPIVPIGRWFQLEFFYNDAADSSGHFSMWLDGTLIYDVARSMSGSPVIYFAVCSLIEDGAASDLFIDDIAVSWTRVTPFGVLKL